MCEQKGKNDKVYKLNVKGQRGREKELARYRDRQVQRRRKKTLTNTSH